MGSVWMRRILRRRRGGWGLSLGGGRLMVSLVLFDRRGGGRGWIGGGWFRREEGEMGRGRKAEDVTA